MSAMSKAEEKKEEKHKGAKITLRKQIQKK